MDAIEQCKNIQSGAHDRCTINLNDLSQIGTISENNEVCM